MGRTSLPVGMRERKPSLKKEFRVLSHIVGRGKGRMAIGKDLPI